MKRRHTVKGIVSLFLAAATAVIPLFLYFYLVRHGAGDAMMYTRGGILFVCVFSFVAAALVFFLTKEPLYTEEDSADSEAQVQEEDIITDSPPCDDDMTVGFGGVKEEYPELFERNEPSPFSDTDEGQASSVPSYYEALAKAMGLQKSMVAENETEEKQGERFFAGEDIMGISAEQEEEKADIYDDLPDTLPEGYVIRDFEKEETAESDEPLKSVSTYERKRIRDSVSLRTAACVLAAVLSCAFAAVLSFNSTLYTEDGFVVRSLFSSRSYTWEDCTEYEIGLSVLGDRVKVTVRTEDGRSAELLPFGAVMTDGFFEKYKNIYTYAVDVTEKLSGMGAERIVKERKTLENEFVNGTDIGEYIEKLIN